MSSSVVYFWDHCPQWLFQWFIGGSFYVVVCVWSFTEFIRIIIKLSKIKQIQLLKQNNENKPAKSDLNSHLSSDDFNMSYNFNFSVHKQINGCANNTNSNNTDLPNYIFESKTCSQSSNYNIYPTTKQPTDLNKQNKSNKIRVFGSRSSQKAFLIVIFFQSLFRSIECLSIAFLKKITSSQDTNCSMAVVDSMAGANSIWYMYCESLGSLLFPMAFSCLAYQLAKIYYRFNYESISLEYVQRNIYSFLFALVILNTICFMGTFILLFWIQFDNHRTSNTTLETYMVMLYSIMCIILSFCYARFAFPIYKMYRRIMFILNHKTNTNTIIGGNYNSKNNRKERIPSIKSIEDGKFFISPQISEDKAELNDMINCNMKKESSNDDGSLLYSDYYDIYQLETQQNGCYKYCCCCINKNRINCNYYDQNDIDTSSITKVKMPTDAQMFYAQFIASMKRTWIVSFYCGMAFLIRAIILFIPPIRNWYENKVYIHALYFLLLEILPIFAMLYIYGNATKSIGKH
eukprot:301355_1